MNIGIIVETTPRNPQRGYPSVLKAVSWLCRELRPRAISVMSRVTPSVSDRARYVAMKTPPP